MKVYAQFYSPPFLLDFIPIIIANLFLIPDWILLSKAYLHNRCASNFIFKVLNKLLYEFSKKNSYASKYSYFIRLIVAISSDNSSQLSIAMTLYWRLSVSLCSNQSFNIVAPSLCYKMLPIISIIPKCEP